jgi:hypothetical protein
LVADVDQHPLIFVVNEIDATADPPAGLVIHLNHTRK